MIAILARILGGWFALSIVTALVVGYLFRARSEAQGVEKEEPSVRIALSNRI